MDVSAIKQFLIWSTVINYAMVSVWFAVFALWHDGLYRLHTRWFRLAPETFDALNYGGMAVYKIGVLLFNLVPLLVLLACGG